MRFSNMTLLLALVLTLSTTAQARMLSKAVGLVGEQVITSREVQINYIVEQILFPTSKRSRIDTLSTKGKSFSSEVTNVLLEWVVHFEAQSFDVASLRTKDIGKAYTSVRSRARRLDQWQRLEVGETELKRIVARKLRAKAFIRFKASSSVVPITDAEAKAYFDKNKPKFGKESFETFKSNIKTFLSKQQVDNRLKDWFEVLQRKYSVRNLAVGR